jgi:hypothetical protein
LSRNFRARGIYYFKKIFRYTNCIATPEFYKNTVFYSNSLTLALLLWGSNSFQLAPLWLKWLRREAEENYHQQQQGGRKANYFTGKKRQSRTDNIS